MTNTRDALRGLGLNETAHNKVNADVVSIEAFEPIAKSVVEAPKNNGIDKKRRGRPTTSHSVTKIHLILEGRGISRKDLYNLIKEKYPDEPISPDAVSRIVSGQRKHYSTPTLYRICGALGVTPNQVLDYEKEIL